MYVREEYYIAIHKLAMAFDSSWVLKWKQIVMNLNKSYTVHLLILTQHNNMCDATSRSKRLKYKNTPPTFAFLMIQNVCAPFEECHVTASYPWELLAG